MTCSQFVEKRQEELLAYIKWCQKELIIRPIKQFFDALCRTIYSIACLPLCIIACLVDPFCLIIAGNQPIIDLLSSDWRDRLRTSKTFPQPLITNFDPCGGYLKSDVCMLFYLQLPGLHLAEIVLGLIMSIISPLVLVCGAAIAIGSAMLSLLCAVVAQPTAKGADFILNMGRPANT